jgi:hypothetical protein
LIYWEIRTAPRREILGGGERWVRHKRRDRRLAAQQLPEFVKDGQKWLDVSLVMGTLIAYEGKKPVFTTVISVARDAALPESCRRMPPRTASPAAARRRRWHSAPSR